MIDTEIIGVDEVSDFIKQMPPHLFESTKGEVSASVFRLHRSIIHPMKTGANGLQSRTGNLARSMKFSVQGTTLASLSGRLFTDSLYAPIHETGGTITAKKAYAKLRGGPYLNIPSSANKTPAGITRKTAKTVFNEGGYLVRITAPKAKYMLMLGGVPMYWLVKSVTIKPTLQMVEKTFDEVPTLLSNLNNILLSGQ